MYLSLCYGQVMRQFFRWSVFSIILLILIEFAWHFAIEMTIGENIYVELGVFISTVLALFAINWHLKSVEAKTTPSLVYGDGKKLFNADNFGFSPLVDPSIYRYDPMILQGKLPRVHYLDNNMKNIDQDHMVTIKRVTRDEEQE